MKTITNPTKDSISVQYLGTVYTVGPEETIKVSAEVATWWKTVHAFMIVGDAAPAAEAAAEVAEVVTEAAPEEEASEDASEDSEESATE